MANAIKKISIARGYDVTRYTLHCFGGAGGQHACAVADALGMTKVFVHPFAGVLSAYGMGLADQSVMRQEWIEKALNAESFAMISERLTALAAEALTALEAKPGVNVRHRVHVKYAGTDTSMELPVSPSSDLPKIEEMFEQAYRKRFAFLMEGRSLVVESICVEASLPGDAPEEQVQDVFAARPLPTRETAQMYCEGVWRDASMIVREDLRPGDVIAGPAIIA